jgi:hypothetical protein
MSIPIYSNWLPQKFFIGAVLTAPIYFEVSDTDEGLDQNTLNIKIGIDDAVVNSVFQAGYHGAITLKDSLPRKIVISVQRNTNWNYGETVAINAQIKDKIGTIGNDNWVFLTIPNPDHTPPIVAASPHGGVFISAQTVTLSSTEPVTIYYTLDGTVPNLSSPVYAAPIPITNEGLTTLKFYGIDANNNYDVLHTEVYEIDTIAPVTHAEPAGGSYFGSQQVRLISNDSRATIYYTTNGTIPNIHSTVYTTPITLRNNYTTRIKYFAVDKAGNVEAVKTDVYTIAIAKNNYRATNVNVMAAYSNALDVKWDDMYEVLTTKIIGYNVYRADVEIGPYVKLNQNLLAVTQYQDQTLDTDVVEEDVSEQFRRTSVINTQANDDFDTPTYNCTKWIETDVAELLYQFNGLLFTDKVGLRQESKLTSKFKLRGDFDITIDFDLLKWLQPATTIQSCIFKVKLTDEDFIQIARDRSNSANVYSANKYTNGNPDLPITVTTTNEYGTFELKRVGNIISAYFFDKNTSTFVLINAFTAYTEDLYIEIVGKSGDVPTEYRWTKFVLKTGAPIIIEPLNPRKEVWIQVQRPPIVDNSGTNKATDDINNVSVTIGGQQAAIKMVQGLEGLIQLEVEKAYDEVKKQWYVPPVPDEHSVVLVTYKTKLQTTKLGLRKKYFYKVTCVTAEDETDLDLLEPEYLKPEKMDYIYQEAVRRNQWLLEHGGERVLVYLKKKAGTVCPCMTRDVKIRSHVRADQDCSSCYGSGFIGGYDGPHPIIIANLTTEQRIMQTERGMKLNYQIETWTGPFPIIAQRDMILRRNGDRVLIGPITPVEGPGGVIVQQHFSIEIIDTTDIRYKFPIKPLLHQFVQPGIDKPGKFVPETNSPKESDALRTSSPTKVENDVNDSINPDRNKTTDHIVKGRTITFENISY